MVFAAVGGRLQETFVPRQLDNAMSWIRKVWCLIAGHRFSMVHVTSRFVTLGGKTYSELKETNYGRCIRCGQKAENAKPE